MFGLSPVEILVVLVIAVFAFGAKKIPDIGKALGRMGSEFTEGKKEAMGDSDEKAEGERAKDGSDPDGFDFEDQLKSQILNRVPGVGQVQRLKKTVETATKVADAVTRDKSGKS